MSCYALILIRLWRLKTEKKIDLMSFFNVDKRVFEDAPFPSFEGHDASIRVLTAFSDGVRFLSGSDDKSIKLWDVGTRVVFLRWLGTRKEF